MTLAQLVMAGLVFLVALPAAFYNRTAGALVGAYLLVQGVWLATGEALPAFALFYIDLLCLAAIYTRPEIAHPFCRCASGAYRSFQRQLCGLWLERSLCDRFVIACFPAAWYFYGTADPWWPLYWISIAQLLAASGEGLQHFLRRRAANAAPGAPDQRSGAEFAWAGAG